jgi:hypothetical protein
MMNSNTHRKWNRIHYQVMTHIVSSETWIKYISSFKRSKKPICGTRQLLARRLPELRQFKHKPILSSTPVYICVELMDTPNKCHVILKLIYVVLTESIGYEIGYSKEQILSSTWCSSYLSWLSCNCIEDSVLGFVGPRHFATCYISLIAWQLKCIRCLRILDILVECHRT